MTLFVSMQREEEKVKIKINIAGESFILSVPYSGQETARRTESEVNTLFETWRNRFPEKNDRELLAMIAFRFAEHYSALRDERIEAEQELDSLSLKIDDYLKAASPES